MAKIKRKWVLRSREIAQSCALTISKLDVDGELLEVILRPYKKNRSLDQNAYLWRINEAFARAVGNSPHDMHDDLLKEYSGTVYSKNMKGEQIARPRKRSSEMSVKEMSAYLDWLHQFAAEWGVAV